jgi:hypothetical protein
LEIPILADGRIEQDGDSRSIPSQVGDPVFGWHLLQVVDYDRRIGSFALLQLQAGFFESLK